MEDIKSILEEYTKEVKRHNSVLKEDFDSKVQTIAEQYDSIDKKLDFHGRMLGSHDDKLNSINAKLDSHSEMIGGIKEDVTVIKMDIEFIKNCSRRKLMQKSLKPWKGGWHFWSPSLKRRNCLTILGYLIY